MKKILPCLFIILLIFIFFWQFFLKGLLPIPADTIVGLYHPFRDLYTSDYVNGIPFKNFLITDPVRQQYPWKELVILCEKGFQLPLWNPYNSSGTPLLANFQSAVFYPLNAFLFLMPFYRGWSFLIVSGPLLAGIFLFMYLDNIKLNKLASIMGAIVFSFSGFFVSWLEWGNITHTALWLSLILLAIDKITQIARSQSFNIKNNKLILWTTIYLFSLVFSFFAGHLQVFFYLFAFSWAYLLARWFQYGRIGKVFLMYLVLNVLFLLFTAIQWIPTFQFILLSARNVDIVGLNVQGWFVPWQNIVQFVVPDYFGNPTTMNYWGVWNYGEFIGYVGMLPLILALFALFFRKDNKTFFFGITLFLALFLVLPTLPAKIPYVLKIPFLSTAQPTRLLYIIDFALAVLSALGFDYLLKTKNKSAIIYPLIFILIILSSLWIFIPREHFQVVRSNLILPTLLFIFSIITFIALIIFRLKKKLVFTIGVVMLVITFLDLSRFGWKFETFSQQSYLFPSSKILTFLQTNIKNFRFMTTDSRIMPPNFSTIYRLQSVDGYDPLYLQRYGELIIASERKSADISSPFGFYRIITPHNYQSRIMDLLGVKYVLSFSFSNLDLGKLTKVFIDGQTVIYENKNVIPRAFFVKEIRLSKSKEESIRMLFDSTIDLSKIGIVENIINKSEYSVGSVNIAKYSENEVAIETKNKGDGFLILTDSFYPTWKASIDNNLTKIYLSDYNFRGIVVPSGNHTIKFYNSLF
jgi:hypothetical protein